MQAPVCQAQLAPGGHTGAINTPTAAVLGLGTAEFGLINNNPEIARVHPSAGHFGSAVLGFGVLPGLELVSRVAFEGDLNCSQFNAGCQSSLRDLSVSGKYQLPLEAPLNARLALGFNDYGGAATNFRQAYGVASARWEFLEWSVGYGSGSSPAAFLKGSFANATLHINDQLRVKAEHDGTRQRLGVSWRQAISATLALSTTLSRQTSGSPDLQKSQIGIGLHWFLDGDKKAHHPPPQQATPVPLLAVPPVQPSPSEMSAAPNWPAAPELTSSKAELIAAHWARYGFRNIHVALMPEQTLRIQAEPVAWRKSQTHALGAALAAWLRDPGSGDRLHLTLTYLEQPTRTLETTRECARAFIKGENNCNGQAALMFDVGAKHSLFSGWVVKASHPHQFHPEFELGLATAYAVGTEYGLMDYSLGLDLGWQVPLAQGLLWQGNGVSPLSSSDDFRAPRGYWKNDRIPSGVQTSLLSYQTQLMRNLWGQISHGKIAAGSQGEQLNLTWLNPSGRWRVTGIQGHYKQAGNSAALKPQLVSTRYSVLPGLWSLDLTAGQFYGGDRGVRLMSDHWFGEHRLTFYVRETAATHLPKTRFAGFELTVPLGPKRSHFVGPVSVRGRDHFPVGLSTKIGAKDNYITPGYGLVPMLRHGLNDILDQDRAGLADLQTQQHRIRSVLQSLLHQGPAP